MSTSPRSVQPVVQLLIGGDAADAAYAAQSDRLADWRFLLAGLRLHEAQHARRRHHVFQHLQVARLEDVERQRGARQQDGTLQGKHG
jgi:hypothetical protein